MCIAAIRGAATIRVYRGSPTCPHMVAKLRHGDHKAPSMKCNTT